MTAVERCAPGLRNATAPPERRGIARDAVRMLVTSRANRAHAHEHFTGLPSHLNAGDVLVVNDSATVAAALDARRANGETFKLHVATAIDFRLWLVEPRATAVRAGEEVQLPGGGSALLVAPVEPKHPRVWYAWFHLPVPMYDYLAKYGEAIRYGYVTDHFPLSDYQTIFARVPGSSEMASAARPFTPRTLHALRERGVEILSVTLHCGVASFEAPERPTLERFVVPVETADAVNRARREGRRVIAIGTTVLRALESASHESVLHAASGWTDLVIDETHRVQTVDGLLTGFHDTAATHQWILRAFLDGDLLAEAYAEASAAEYLQHEFGDAHLIL